MKLNICVFDKKFELLEKYNKILKEVKNSIKKRFDSEPIYNRKYVKAKTKSYERKIKRDFPEVGS